MRLSTKISSPVVAVSVLTAVSLAAAATRLRYAQLRETRLWWRLTKQPK